jgi:hypothetical protein
MFAMTHAEAQGVDPRSGAAGQGDRRDLAGARRFGWFLPAAAAIGVAVIGLALWVRRGGGGSDGVVANVPAPYDASRAYGYLVALCDIGPRPASSPAMKRQQDYLREFFQGRGAEVTLQAFSARHPETGEGVELANLIASWHPDRPKRYLLAAHYDTRPYPDRDPVDPKGRFVGANDGASGVAALMELSHHLGDLPADVGVDIVLFDGEELVVVDPRDDYFLGSTYFARQYAAQPPAIKYRAGILLDMVGDRELAIFYERNSWQMAREVTRSLFKTAERLGVTAFVPRIRHEIRDDHLPLNEIAKIPTTDLIDFDYPRPGFGVQSHWHTTRDVPEQCSGQSLATVVYVVHAWLKSQ